MRKAICRWAWLAVVLVVASCSPKSEYVNSLPKDAALVVSFDLKTMAEKGGLQGKEGEKMVDKLTAVLKSGLEGDAYQMAERIVRRPAESGLDLTDKVYLFATPQSHAFALLAKVDDEGKVGGLMKALQQEQLCTSLQSESGCRWTQMGNALCAFNQGTFLLLASTKGDVLGMKETLFALMRQETANSFAATADFARLSAAQGEVVSVVNLSLLPSELTMQVRMGMPGYLKLEDMKYLVSMTFESGKIAVDTEALIENKELKAMYERGSEVLSSIRGTYMEHFPASTLWWMCGNLEGKKVYDLLSENPSIRQSLNNPLLPIDLESIFSAIQGDVAFGWTDKDLLLYADVANRDFLHAFEELRPLFALTGGQMKLNTVGPDRYEFRMYGQSIWFGVKDGYFYLSTSEKMADEAGRRYGVSLQNAPWADQVKENRFFLTVNAAQLAKWIDSRADIRRQLSGEATVVTWVLNACDYLTLMSPGWQKAHLDIVIRDKETNVLRQIVRGLENL